MAKQTPLFLDGGPSPVCNAALPLVAKSGPVDYCLSPAIVTTPFGYIFSASAPSVDVQRVAVRYFRLRGWKRVAMLSSTDASGVALECKAVAALALPENRDVQFVAQERFAPTDVSAAAQATRIEAAKPDAIFVWATGTPVATAFRALNDAGNTLPVQVPSSNMVYSQLESYSGIFTQATVLCDVVGLDSRRRIAGSRTRRADGVPKGVQSDRRAPRCRNEPRLGPDDDLRRRVAPPRTGALGRSGA